MEPFSTFAMMFGALLALIAIRFVRWIYPITRFNKFDEQEKKYFLKSWFMVVWFFFFLPSFLLSL